MSLEFDIDNAMITCDSERMWHLCIIFYKCISSEVEWLPGRDSHQTAEEVEGVIGGVIGSAAFILVVLVLVIFLRRRYTCVIISNILFFIIFILGNYIIITVSLAVLWHWISLSLLGIFTDIIDL